MIRKYIIVADDSIKGFDEEIAKLEREWGAEEIEPSDDCVRRDDVDAYIAKLMSGYLYDEERTRLEAFSAYLWELPSVTPERPKGKWNFIGYQMFECSSCKSAYTQNQFEELKIYTTDDLLPKFCPNCGADMRGGAE